MPHKIPIKIIPIEDDGYHVCIEAGINDKAALLLIDTGASRTVFDAERINNFIAEKDLELKEMEKLSTGLGTNTMKSHIVVVDSLELGELILKDFETVVIDMKHINDSYEKIGLTPIDGVIGGDILVDYSAVLDYGEKMLVVAE